MELPSRLLLPIICLIILTASPNFAKAPLQENTERLIVVQENTVMASISPHFIALNGVLGVYLSEDGSNYEELVLLNKIIECESNWRNVCNAKYGCRAGQGVAQLIPTTVRYCEEKLGKKIDPFCINDSVECAVWLLENEGHRHWGTEITNWGSYNCWKHYIN